MKAVRILIAAMLLFAAPRLSAPLAAEAEAAAVAPAAEPAVDEKAKEEAAEEFKKKREAERREQLAEAEEFVHSADETVARLPYPLNFLLGASFHGITLWRYLAALGLVAAGFGLLLYVSRRFRKARRQIDGDIPVTRAQEAVNVLIAALRTPLKVVIVGLLLRGVSSLLVTSIHPDILRLSDIVVFLGVVLYFFVLAGVVDEVYGDRIFKSDNRTLETVRPIVLKGARIVILVVAGMHIYEDLTGQTMVSLLAGLGIGGLALALASQTTLQNLLGFASIALEKTLLVGDTVNIDNHEGTLEHIGIRSLRIRAYDGSAVIVPNNTAINSDVANLTRRAYVRREMQLALSPANPYEKVKEAMDLVAEVLADHQGKVAGLPPVVRFLDYQPARFVIQGLFWYDANKPFFQDECSRVNLEVCRRLSEAGVLYAER